MLSQFGNVVEAGKLLGHLHTRSPLYLRKVCRDKSQGHGGTNLQKPGMKRLPRKLQPSGATTQTATPAPPQPHGGHTTCIATP